MSESITFNEDCMAVMARYPDKYFDLAVVDPPYGDALADPGGELTYQRFGGVGSRFEKYKRAPQERERENAVTRTGGTWAEKYGKKS